MKLDARVGFIFSHIDTFDGFPEELVFFVCSSNDLFCSLHSKIRNGNPNSEVKFGLYSYNYYCVFDGRFQLIPYFMEIMNDPMSYLLIIKSFDSSLYFD